MYKNKKRISALILAFTLVFTMTAIVTALAATEEEQRAEFDALEAARFAQFEADEAARWAEFEKAEKDRWEAFEKSEIERWEAFEKSEIERWEAFEKSEKDRYDAIVAANAAAQKAYDDALAAYNKAKSDFERAEDRAEAAYYLRQALNNARDLVIATRNYAIYVASETAAYMSELSNYNDALAQHGLDEAAYAQYLIDLGAYNALLAQYNIDLAAYNAYLAAKAPYDKIKGDFDSNKNNGQGAGTDVIKSSPAGGYAYLHLDPNGNTIDGGHLGGNNQNATLMPGVVLSRTTGQNAGVKLTIASGISGYMAVGLHVNNTATLYIIIDLSVAGTYEFVQLNQFGYGIVLEPATVVDEPTAPTPPDVVPDPGTFEGTLPVLDLDPFVFIPDLTPYDGRQEYDETFDEVIPVPDVFTPNVFTPGTFEPGTFTPGVFTPGTFVPGTFVYIPDEITPPDADDDTDADDDADADDDDPADDPAITEPVTEPETEEATTEEVTTETIIIDDPDAPLAPPPGGNTDPRDVPTAPAAAPVVPVAAPAAPVVPADEETIVLDDPEVPLAGPVNETEETEETETEPETQAAAPVVIDIDEPEIPLVNIEIGSGRSWHLWNLVLSIGCVLLAVAMGIRAIAGNKKDEDDENAGARKKNLFLALAIPAAAIVSCVIFILTQDMTAPMAAVDTWTLAHAGLFAAGLVSFIFADRKVDETEKTNA